MKSRKILIIAGPRDVGKGAGKTTLARAFLPHEAQCPRFINADLIAAGLSPHAIDEAVIHRRFAAGVDIWEYYDDSKNPPILLQHESTP